ncbi:MAG: PhzF family phenazine biosynthesis protein [Bacteroidales bacterium]|nr:PhzF family phenazine biosynthesis protein [Bacteroidales bacterium]
MRLQIFQVDAFTNQLFHGNPAAICPLNNWLEDAEMQNIASENNLSETAFFVPVNDSFQIRWFTPAVEVDLCGHATLATAHVLFNHLNYEKRIIHFDSKSGLLTVRKDNEFITLNFPSTRLDVSEATPILVEAIGINPVAVYESDDLLVLLNSEAEVSQLEPDFNLLSKLSTRGIIVTAAGKDCDFVSRFFAPAVGINEDPVTGSAHTKLTPFWAEKLDKETMTARQLSKRGGDLKCTCLGDRVEISGKAMTYMIGEIFI